MQITNHELVVFVACVLLHSGRVAVARFSVQLADLSLLGVIEGGALRLAGTESRASCCRPDARFLGGGAPRQSRPVLHPEIILLHFDLAHSQRQT